MAAPADKDSKGKKPENKQVQDVISSFEQILDAMPNDRLALETLCDAYEQVGDTAKALEYLTRLGKVVADDGDTDTAALLAVKLRSVAGDNQQAQDVIAQLDRLTGQPQAAAQPGGKATETAKRKTVDIGPELALAWNLVQAGEMSKDDYSAVMHDLTESSTKNVEVPVTVLHVLHDRGFKGYEKVLNHLAADSGIPILSLTNFEVTKDVAHVLPLEFMMHRGGIVFELMGKEALVGVLNPYDTEVRADVQRITGRTCHFYLVPAESYDKCLENIRKILKEEAEKAGKTEKKK